jgi:hypothetical protein
MAGYFLDSRIDDDHIRIIGVEFTIDMANGGNQEMEMYTPSGLLIIPRSHPNYNPMLMPKITFHSSIGDYSIGGRNGGQYAPW